MTRHDDKTLLIGEPWTVSRTAVVAQPQSHLWEVISTPGYLERCHPFCARNTVATWPGADARDLIVYRSGLELHRHITEWREGHGYALDIGPKGRSNYQVRWQLGTVDEARSAITISLTPYLPSSQTEEDFHAAYMRKMRRANTTYLESVVAGIRHVAETGEPVRPDQFGAHPVYSAPEALAS